MKLWKLPRPTTPADWRARVDAIALVWVRLAGAAERHPLLVLRAMRQLVRVRLAAPWLQPARDLLTLADEGFRPNRDKRGDELLRAAAPLFAAAAARAARVAREAGAAP